MKDEVIKLCHNAVEKYLWCYKIGWTCKNIPLTYKSLREIKNNMRVKMNLNTWNVMFYPYISRMDEIAHVWCCIFADNC